MSIKVLELLLIAGVAFGLGFWQLYDVDRAMKNDRAEDDGDPCEDAGDTDRGPTQEPGSNPRN